MYFKEKEDTNIDKEFDQKKAKGFNLNFNPKLLLFIVGGIVLLFVIIFLISSLSNGNRKSKYTIELLGNETITINVGDEYVDPGYVAFDNNNNNVTSDVEITSTIDNTKAGNYEVLYSIGTTNVIRYVNVIETVEATYIRLLGKKNMYLEIGERYNEPGYEVYDSKDSNLIEQVTIKGTVDTSKKGIYRINYTVVNSRNITTSVERTVIVVEKGQKPTN